MKKRYLSFNEILEISKTAKIKVYSYANHMGKRAYNKLSISYDGMSFQWFEVSVQTLNLLRESKFEITYSHA